MKTTRITWPATLLVLLITLLPSLLMADTWFSLPGRTVRGSGDIIREVRETEDFNCIRLECSVDLLVNIGNRRSVKITADDNLMELVTTEVSHRGTLLIDVERSYRSRHGILIEITIPTLEAIEVNGSGEVVIVDLDEQRFEIDLDGSGDVEVRGNADRLEISVGGSGEVEVSELEAQLVLVDIRGSGDVTLEGKTEMVEITVRGSGDVHARRLKSDRVNATVHGSGDISVYAKTEFEGEINGSGDIQVYGNPREFYRDIDGSGDITRR